MIRVNQRLKETVRSVGAAVARGLRVVSNVLHAWSWWLEQRCQGGARGVCTGLGETPIPRREVG